MAEAVRSLLRHLIISALAVTSIGEFGRLGNLCAIFFTL
jgi:hypothetical protein